MTCSKRLKNMPSNEKAFGALSLGRWLGTTAFAASLFLVMAPVGAQPEHSCEPPEKPETFENREQQDEFIEEAQAYMDCLKEFFDEQAEISREAAEAANAARAEMEEYAASVNN